MEATISHFFNRQTTKPQHWGFAWVLALVLHLIIFVNYQLPVSNVGAKDDGFGGIEIGLASLTLPSKVKKQSVDRPKPKPKPAPIVVPEIQEEPAIEEKEAFDDEDRSGEQANLGGGDASLKVIYNNRLLAWLERNKDYPAVARRRGQQDTVIVQFVIDAEGHLLRYSFEQASRYSLLNKEAEKMLKRASPLPSVPQDLRLGKSEFSYIVPIEFKLTR